MNSQSVFSLGPPLSESGSVWSPSESAGAGWVAFGCLGVSEVAGRSVPSSVEFLPDVATALYSADA